MKLLDTCGCFPTGRHYPGIAHLVEVHAAGLADEFEPDAAWQDLPIGFLDTETTGKDPTVDRVIEVGLVVGRGGQVVARHRWLLHPGMSIPEASSAIHGIKDADVAEQPVFDAVVVEILAALAGVLPAAYNAEFDRGFLLAELDRSGHLPEQPPPAFRRDVQWLDPLVFARELYPGRQSRALGAVCERLGIELVNAHRATDDAEAALMVLYGMAADPRVPAGYAALVREQARLGRAQEEARRFWRK